MDFDGNKGVFQRLRPSGGGGGGAGGGGDSRNQKVCFHWRAGKCNRFPCPYLHRELPAPHLNNNNGTSSAKRSQGFSNDQNFIRRSPNFNGSSTWGRVHGGGANSHIVKKTEKLCNFWTQGKCAYGDKCKYLHSWCTGDFSLLTQLEGHQKVVTGITMPSGSDKLYTGGKDETVRLWDCQSGQCAAVINLGGEVGCMLNEGPWVFVGLPNMVKAWNTQTNTELSLVGPVGQVHALVVGNGLLFAGTQDGTILAWRFNAAVNNFEPAASLTGHTMATVTLIVGANRLYSGSMDNSIRVWSLDNFQCLQTLTDHTSVVMSILCWEQFLLSCSLDNTIKVWAATESGNLEATYTHSEDTGLLALCGMHDLEGKPILLCSCNDNTARAYDLPSFSERGKIFAKQEIRTIQIGPGGLFFTGDGAGSVKVWNWSPPTSSAANA
ncbi:zinc finger CCCH domain-containing protein 48-like [Impatiens glandulifera]|uniref:zinc finger CCCH domain-containing protein 48-like n=1 Tax=Impatiens glandulifera TaxID=253017 RepID=UPI001FB12710|nr:zinc finger CCCH domain-containing protein 48-like [Impatiens glandulifera]